MVFGSIGKNFLIDEINHEKHLSSKNVFTEYNPYTITSRPSNRHLVLTSLLLTKKMVHENVSFHKKVNCSYNLITMPFMFV